MGMTLPIQTHLITRNGAYYFRRRIPKELLQFYYPKTEIIFSLRTKKLKTAERLAHVDSVKLDDEFHRVKLNEASPCPPINTS